jgi:hypothetical protein
LFIFPAFLSIASIDEYARSENLFTKDLLVLVLMSAALVVAGRVLSSAAKKDSNVVGKIYDGSTLVVFGTIFIWIIVWLFVHNLLPNTPDMATMITLVIYTIAGLLAYFAGLFGHDKARRVYGAGLLAFVVARLLFVDVWDMELFGRVLTFFVIGTLLMSTAFYSRKIKMTSQVSQQ